MSDFVGLINHLCTQGLTGAPVAQRSLMVAIALSDEGQEAAARLSGEARAQGVPSCRGRGVRYTGRSRRKQVCTSSRKPAHGPAV